MIVRFVKDFTRFKKHFKKGDVAVVGVDLAAHAVPIVLDEGFAEAVQESQPPAPAATKAPSVKTTAKDKPDAG